jgi:hypothetical protein
VILDEIGCMPFSASGGAQLFHMLSKLCEPTSIAITTNLSFSEWATVFGDVKMTTALLDHLTHRCYSLETGNDTFRFKASSVAATLRWLRSHYSILVHRKAHGLRGTRPARQAAARSCP